MRRNVDLAVVLHCDQYAIFQFVNFDEFGTDVTNVEHGNELWKQKKETELL